MGTPADAAASRRHRFRVTGAITVGSLDIGFEQSVGNQIQKRPQIVDIDLHNHFDVIIVDVKFGNVIGAHGAGQVNPVGLHRQGSNGHQQGKA